MDRYRLAGPAPLRGADLLLKHRGPARSEYPLRGLVSLRHHQRLRGGPRVWQHPRPDLRDLRRICLGRLPRNKPRRTPGAGWYGHDRVRQRPVPAAAGNLHLCCAQGGAGIPGGHRAVCQAALHLRRYHVRANWAAVLLARLRGQHPPWGSGLALWDVAEVGRSPLGRRERADVLESRVWVDDWPGEYPGDGARWRTAAGDKRSVDSLECPEPTLCRGGGSSSGPAEGALSPA